MKLLQNKVYSFSTLKVMPSGYSLYLFPTSSCKNTTPMLLFYHVFISCIKQLHDSHYSGSSSCPDLWKMIQACWCMIKFSRTTYNSNSYIMVLTLFSENTCFPSFMALHCFGSKCFQSLWQNLDARFPFSWTSMVSTSFPNMKFCAS